MIKTNNYLVLQGDQELHQSDSDSNDNKQLNRNQSTHSLINQTSTYQTSNTTRQNLTTNEPLHNQERNNGKTEKPYLIRHHITDSI